MSKQLTGNRESAIESLDKAFSLLKNSKEITSVNFSQKDKDMVTHKSTGEKEEKTWTIINLQIRAKNPKITD